MKLGLGRNLSIVVFDICVAALIALIAFKYQMSVMMTIGWICSIEGGLLMSRFVYFFKRGQGLYATRTLSYCLLTLSIIFFTITLF